MVCSGSKSDPVTATGWFDLVMFVAHILAPNLRRLTEFPSLIFLPTVTHAVHAILRSLSLNVTDYLTSSNSWSCMLLVGSNTISTLNTTWTLPSCLRFSPSLTQYPCLPSRHPLLHSRLLTTHRKFQLNLSRRGQWRRWRRLTVHARSILIRLLPGYQPRRVPIRTSGRHPPTPSSHCPSPLRRLRWGLFIHLHGLVQNQAAIERDIIWGTPPPLPTWCKYWAKTSNKLGRSTVVITFFIFLLLLFRYTTQYFQWPRQRNPSKDDA